MSMQDKAREYLALRQALGRKMAADGRMLLDFAARLDEAGQGRVIVAAALEWATASSEASPGHLRRRLGIVRGFARHMHALDPTSEVSPADLIIAPRHRKPPYVYSQEEISALVHAAGTITTPLAVASIQAPARPASGICSPSASWARTSCTGASGRARPGPGSWSSAAACAPCALQRSGSRSSVTTSART